jgi:DNA polymerase
MVYDTKRGKVIIPNRIYGGKCTENFTQALARIIVGQQMLKIAKRYRVVMTVHDSVVTLVPEAEADEARKYIEQCMRSRPKWAPTLPLNCESKVGASYGG